MEWRCGIPFPERKDIPQAHCRYRILHFWKPHPRQFDVFDTLIEFYRHIVTDGVQKHHGNGPIWRSRLVMDGHLLPIAPVYYPKRGMPITLDPMAPYVYFLRSVLQRYGSKGWVQEHTIYISSGHDYAHIQWPSPWSRAVPRW